VGVVTALVILLQSDDLKVPFSTVGASVATQTEAVTRVTRAATATAQNAPIQLTPTASRPTDTPTATHTLPPTATQTPIPTATPVPSPTAIVCNSLDGIQGLTLEPGQSFDCTFDQQELTQRLGEQPDLPCSSVDVVLENGEAVVTCHMGLLELTAVGVVEVEECEMSIRIVRGTAGFAQLAQEMLEANAQLFPIDRICVESAEIGDGTIEISGYGR